MCVCVCVCAEKSDTSRREPCTLHLCNLLYAWSPARDNTSQVAVCAQKCSTMYKCWSEKSNVMNKVTQRSSAQTSVCSARAAYRPTLLNVTLFMRLDFSGQHCSKG
eukprot:scpid71276/ scgid6162/ 